MTVTKHTRAAIKAHVDANTKFDAATVRISADGTVSAKRDQNKTSLYDGSRYDLGNVTELIKSINQ